MIKLLDFKVISAESRSNDFYVVNFCYLFYFSQHILVRLHASNCSCQGNGYEKDNWGNYTLQKNL